MLDSGIVTDEPPPAYLSASLGALALIFGGGAWATWKGGQRERTPLVAGVAIGVGGYAVARLFL